MILVFLFGAALTSFAQTAWVPSNDPPEYKRERLWPPADRLFLGASFVYRDTTDSIVVWLDTSETGDTGKLYVMLPGSPDSALFLFQNLNNAGPTRVNISKAIRFPAGAEVFFMYMGGQNRGLPRYTGRNRVGTDRFVSREYSLAYPDTYGHNWSVAGRVVNGASRAPTDTAVFGFEGGASRPVATDTLGVVTDYDFDEVVFGVTGLYLNVEVFPDSLALRLSADTVRAGEAVACTLLAYGDSSNAAGERVRVRASAFEKFGAWRLVGAAVHGDSLALDSGATNRFDAATARRTFTIRDSLRNPANDSTIRIERRVYVLPGRPAMLSIEHRADTAKPGFDLFRPVPLPQLTIASNVNADSVYGAIRDHFGNFAGFSQSVLWDTATNPAVATQIPGIASVRSGRNLLGEGVISKAGGNGDIYVIGRHIEGADTMRDSVLVTVAAASYDSLRLVRRATGQTDSVLSSLDLTTDDWIRIVVQGRRTDNASRWDSLAVQWQFSAPWTSFSRTSTAYALQFAPQDTGHGTLSVVYQHALRHSLAVAVLPGAPASIALYGGRGPLPSDTVVKAGARISLAAKVFDRLGVQLTQFAAGQQSTSQLAWNVEERHGADGGPDTSGLLSGQTGPLADYMPLRAFRSVRISVRLSSMSDSVRLDIRPGPARELTIEHAGSAAPALFSPDLLDTLTIADDQTHGDALAMLRDSLGNLVDSSRGTAWGALDSTVAVSRGASPSVGRVEKNTKVAAADRIHSTRVYARDTTGLSDTVWVRLLPYHYTELRVIAGSAAIDSLRMSTNDDTVLNAQGRRSDTKEWETTSAQWVLDSTLGLEQPVASAADSAHIVPRRPGTGWLRARLPDRTDVRDSVRVTFTVGRPTSIQIELAREQQPVHAGDTLEAVVRIRNQDGPVPGHWCASPDSSSGPARYRDNLTPQRRAARPVVIVGGKAVELSDSSRDWSQVTQCFGDGIDSVRAVVYYVPSEPDSLHQLAVSIGGVQAYTAPFRILPGPLAGLAVDNNLKPRGDTVLLRAPDDWVMLYATGLDRYGNRLGEVPARWRTSGTLHAIDHADSAGRALYKTDSSVVKDDQQGALRAAALADSAFADSVQVRIVGPLAAIAGAVTRDRNGNGFLDAVDITFSLGVHMPDMNASKAFRVTCGADTFTVSGIAAVEESSRHYRLSLDERRSARAQTAWLPTVHFTGTGLFADEAVDSCSVVCADGAGPVVWRATKRVVVEKDRSQDVVTVTFSEPVLARSGSSLIGAAGPEQTLRVWQPNAEGTMDSVAALTGISRFESADSSTTFSFRTSNGFELTERQLISIRADNAQAPESWLVDSVALNPPERDNRKSPILVFGDPPRVISVAPCPAKPFGRRVRPGAMDLRHNPAARGWVRDDGGGVVLSFRMLLPDQPRTSMQGRIAIYDIVGNTVIASPPDRYQWTSVLGDGSFWPRRIEAVDLPGAWQEHGAVYEFDIYWNGYNTTGLRVAPGIYHAALTLVMESGGKKTVLKYDGKIGIRQ